MADYLHGSLEITLSFVHARQALYQLSGFANRHLAQKGLESVPEVSWGVRHLDTSESASTVFRR